MYSDINIEKILFLDIETVSQYSEYDVSDIRAEFRKKEEWYKEKYGG